MKLRDIIQDISAVEIRGSLDREITALTSDSREVVPGALFVAVKGFASDGHAYIASALEKGAATVICEEIPGQAGKDATFIRVENSRHAVAMAADASSATRPAS